MAGDTLEPVPVESDQGSGGLEARFKAIPGLRWKLDEDRTAIGYSNRDRMVGDKLYAASEDLLGLYIVRRTERAFNSAVRGIRKVVSVKREQLGDMDGIVFFPWEEVYRLPWFFRRECGTPGNIEALKKYWESRKA